MDPEDAKYVCSLDDASLKVAKEELHEDPKDRLSSVQTLRKWVKEQPHLHCWTDTSILLMYLRGAKYSQLRARELIQNTLAMMTKVPQLLQNLDPLDEGVQEYLKAGFYLVLPLRDKLNRQIMFVRQAAVSHKNPHFCLKNEMRAGMIVDRLLRDDEMTQVHGFVVIVDFTGFSMKHMKEWTPDNTKKKVKAFQDALPGRVKSMNVYNAGSFFEMIFTLAKPIMKKKFVDRMKVHSTLESLYKVVPMELLPQEYLPDDYKGPTIGSLKSLTDSLYDKITSPAYREYVLRVSSDKYGVDLDKQPDAINTASFRQISLD